MTIRAIAGLLGLNVFVFGVGLGVLWGIRGWRSWAAAFRLAGVAYLLGLASLFVVWTLELVVGVPFRSWTIVLSGIGITGAGVLIGRWQERARPGFHPRGRRLPRPSVFGALFLAAIVVYFEALFRSARLQGVGQEWDAWRAWTLRAKALYYFGRLDTHLPSLGQYPSYPPGISELQAAGFHAMGSADVVTLHVQYWFLAVGFAGALAGLLARRVHAAILLPFLLLALVMPGVTEWETWLMADVPMGYLLAVAAVLVALWLEERQPWHLAATTLLLAGAMLTKREGLLFAACIFAAALAVTWRERGGTWVRLAGSALIAFGLALPWRIWFTAHGLAGDGPESGWLGFLRHSSRAWPSVELVLRTTFDYGFWLLLPLLGLAAAVLGFLAGARRLAAFAAVFLGASLSGSAWVIWSNPSFPFTQDYSANPVGRLTGSSALVLAALTPLLLERAWGGAALAVPAWASARAREPLMTAVAWMIVVGALLAYPGSMLVGYSGLALPGGLPRFPSAEDCVRAPVSGQRIRVVFGHARTYPQAFALRARALDAGFLETQVAPDGCGRLRVFVAHVPSVVAGDAMARKAEAFGLYSGIERDGGG